jgi:hypothetical protein
MWCPSKQAITGRTSQLKTAVRSSAGPQEESSRCARSSCGNSMRRSARQANARLAREVHAVRKREAEARPAGVYVVESVLQGY